MNVKINSDIAQLLEFVDGTEPNHLYTPNSTTFVFSRTGRLFHDQFPAAHKNLVDQDDIWQDFAAEDPNALAVPAQGFKRRAIAESQGILGRIGLLNSPVLEDFWQSKYGQPMPDMQGRRLVIVWNSDKSMLDRLLTPCLKKLISERMLDTNCILKCLEFPALTVLDAISGRLGKTAAPQPQDKTYEIGGNTYKIKDLYDMRRHLHVAGADKRYETLLCQIDMKKYPELAGLYPAPCGKFGKQKTGQRWFQQGVYPPHWEWTSFEEWVAKNKGGG